MSLEKLQFTPNVPHEVALKFTEGKIVEGRFGDQVFFTLAHPANSCMYLDLGVAQKINALEVRKNEPFRICKRWSGKKSDPVQWDVWRPQAGEVTPMLSPTPAEATGIPESELEAEVRAEVAARLAKQRPAPQPEASAGTPAPAVTTVLPQPPYTNGNGSTNGHGTSGNNGAPAPYAAAGIPAPPTKVGYDVALRRILRTALAALKDSGEQWSDGARQDLVSTLMIQAARDGAVSWASLSQEVD